MEQILQQGITIPGWRLHASCLVVIMGYCAADLSKIETFSFHLMSTKNAFMGSLWDPCATGEQFGSGIGTCESMDRSSNHKYFAISHF
ncbi:hypothetical protein XELAEV_18011664mg [Xenopus laevis]|uniref:Uncharacterized protein n=1 Tax=Xenopus laevis TaxID=8355 RepID=A0A974DN18_XENLA|nr:hypothetical protein XELAEV_18011664mg [Xenopus laevis]